MGWLFVNVVLPALSPLFLMAVIFMPWRKKFDKNAQALINLLSPIKDGQLCWAGMAFCAAALYEMHESPTASKALWGGDGYLEGVFILLLFMNSFVAASGAVFPADLPRPPDVKVSEHFPVLRRSIGASAVSAILFVVVHFRLAP